jgi:hypothetical protein
MDGARRCQNFGLRRRGFGRRGWVMLAAEPRNGAFRVNSVCCSLSFSNQSWPGTLEEGKAHAQTRQFPNWHNRPQI